MKKWLIAAGVVAAAGFMADPAEAQQFGVKASYADDFDLGIGVLAQTALGDVIDLDEDSPLSPVTGRVGFDWYFPDCGGDCSYFEINADGLYPLEFGEGFAPYVGGGLNIARISFDFGGFGGGDVSNTEIGLNAIGGAMFDLGGFDVGAEAKIELGGGEQFVLAGYVLLGGGDS